MDDFAVRRPQVIVVRGPIAAGKTSAVEALARLLLEQGPLAVVPTDWLRHMVSDWLPEDSSAHSLAVRQAALLAQSFVDAGHQVIIDGPFDDPEILDLLQSKLGDLTWRLFTICPSWQEVCRRHQSRPERQRATSDRLRAVYGRVVEARARTEGVWIESDDMTPDQIATKISVECSISEK